MILRPAQVLIPPLGVFAGRYAVAAFDPAATAHGVAASSTTTPLRGASGADPAMARSAYRPSPGGLALGVPAMAHRDASDALAKVGAPSLIISGKQDVTTLPWASDRMGRERPASTRLSVDRAAHLGRVERDRPYADAIASFAAKPEAAAEAGGDARRVAGPARSSD